MIKQRESRTTEQANIKSSE